MKDGCWYIILEDGRYVTYWVHENADVPAIPETYLDGGFIHRFDAEAVANDANLLIADDASGEKAAALRRIVEGLR